jgi:hypothetical protein
MCLLTIIYYSHFSWCFFGIIRYLLIFIKIFMVNISVYLWDLENIIMWSEVNIEVGPFSMWENASAIDIFGFAGLRFGCRWRSELRVICLLETRVVLTHKVSPKDSHKTNMFNIINEILFLLNFEIFSKNISNYLK